MEVGRVLMLQNYPPPLNLRAEALISSPLSLTLSPRYTGNANGNNWLPYTVLLTLHLDRDSNLTNCLLLCWSWSWSRSHSHSRCPFRAVWTSHYVCLRSYVGIKQLDKGGSKNMESVSAFDDHLFCDNAWRGSELWPSKWASIGVFKWAPGTRLSTQGPVSLIFMQFFSGKMPE